MELHTMNARNERPKNIPKVNAAAINTSYGLDQIQIEAIIYESHNVKVNSIKKFQGTFLTRKLKQNRNIIIVKVPIKAIQYINL